MARPSLAVAVALLAVLAGCAGAQSASKPEMSVSVENATVHPGETGQVEVHIEHAKEVKLGGPANTIFQYSCGPGFQVQNNSITLGTYLNWTVPWDFVEKTCPPIWQWPDHAVDETTMTIPVGVGEDVEPGRYTMSVEVSNAANNEEGQTVTRNFTVEVTARE